MKMKEKVKGCVVIVIFS